LENSNQMLRLSEDWRSLVETRLTLDRGTQERARIDAIYNKALPLMAMINDIQYRPQVPLLTEIALRILEQPADAGIIKK